MRFGVEIGEVIDIREIRMIDLFFYVIEIRRQKEIINVKFLILKF